MAATRPNIVIPANTWVDINAALNAQAGFPSVNLGDALNIKLQSSVSIRLCEKGSQPTATDGYRTLEDKDIPVKATNTVGLWAYAVATDSTINVEVG